MDGNAGMGKNVEEYGDWMYDVMEGIRETGKKLKLQIEFKPAVFFLLSSQGCNKYARSILRKLELS